MRRPRTYFEQVPVVIAKMIASREMISSQSVACVICRKPVKLEDCKIDHNGAAVHEACYVAKVVRA